MKDSFSLPLCNYAFQLNKTQNNVYYSMILIFLGWHTWHSICHICFESSFLFMCLLWGSSWSLRCSGSYIHVGGKDGVLPVWDWTALAAGGLSIVNQCMQGLAPSIDTFNCLCFPNKMNKNKDFLIMPLWNIRVILKLKMQLLNNLIC